MTHAIDHTKGQMIGTVSQQWASRPNDQKFLSLEALEAKTSEWMQQSYTKPVVPNAVKAIWNPDDENALVIELDGAKIAPTNFGFGQIAALAGAPASYLRTLPGALAAVNINYGLQAAQQIPRLAYIRENGETTLRAITSPKYGRIFDTHVVQAVRKIAGNGTGDTPWKVPGCIDWSGKHGITYNPEVDITTESTTLYASDRDVFMFLVDDKHPIEVGKLPDGSPDLVFRGFYVWNSEVGQRTFGVAIMYLRGVCQNRCLWGVEGFTEVSFKHTAGAPDKFALEAMPLLTKFSESGTSKVVAGVKAAKEIKVAVTDDERVTFLQKFGFSAKQANTVIAQVKIEEQHEPESVWDFAMGVTAVARSMQYQDARLQLESVAGKMLDQVAA
ncbi:hypothetical protein UFOVP1040_34 [uncultured Caudovirales phage]|uniref:DUF932 domain-containing protein n=1 Tax=uncultured Caudovirales phage TaxID=2100421 RepID=A0A6J5QFB7_9CAUD|nr:hypothetical protein UFOVP1040_34 [uncultured Caudovirales phage]